MKTLHEVLILIRKQYSLLKNPHEHGLCSVAYNKLINYYEYVKFQTYLAETLKDQKVFYTADGEKTHSTNAYMFPIEDIQSRINWLHKHIELTKPKS